MHTEKFLSIEQIERFLSRDLRIQKEKRGIELKFNLQEYSKDTIDKIFQCVKKYKECNFEPIVSISADELKLKSNDLENLIELDLDTTLIDYLFNYVNNGIDLNLENTNRYLWFDINEELDMTDGEITFTLSNLRLFDERNSVA